MPLSFLNPGLLLGTLAAALPVVIHFLSRRRVRREKFSDLRFLAEVQTRQSRSLGLRRWLLLLLRVLAILCVALAVAGPRWGGLGPVAGTRAVLFILDTSASMNTGQNGGTRLNEARRQCRDMMAALPPGTAVQVLVVGSRVEPLFAAWLPSGVGTERALARVTPSEGRFDFAGALAAAARLVARAPGSPVQVVLLSDLQDGEIGADWAAAAAQLEHAGATNWLVRQIGVGTDGGGVLAVDLPARVVRPGENVSIAAQVISQFPEQVFTLSLAGAQVAEVVADGPVGVPVTVHFPLTVPAVGRYLGFVRKEADAFTADDVRPFVLDVPHVLSVLIVHGEDQPQDGAAGRGGWRYLAAALVPDTGPSLCQIHVLNRDELTTGAIEAAQVVYLVDPDPLGRRLWEGLGTWLEGGGQVVLLAGDPKSASYMTHTILPAWGLPPAATYVVSGAPGQRAHIVDAGHPVFAGFSEGARETFTEVSWQRWYRLAEGQGQVLVALSGEDPLVIAAAVGRGRAVVMSSDLRPESGGLAGSPMALPFFQRLTAWLAGSAAVVKTEVGREAVLRPRDNNGLDRPEDLRVVDDRGRVVSVATLAWRQGQPVLHGGRLEHAGHYVFMAGADTLGVIAAGVPASESVLALRSVAEFSALSQEAGLRVVAALPADAGGSLLDVFDGRSLAGWFLAVAVMLLVVELGVGRGTHQSQSGLKT